MLRFKPVIITATAPSREEAELIGRLLLENGLAACVQYESVSSRYMWNGQLCSGEEIRLVIKTARCHYKAVEKIIVRHHSYDCPQVLMQPVQGGFLPYLKWMKAQLAR
ncbi:MULTISPECIES: divalent-cation tolerance protein CutA [Neisseria]|uniref:CutA1 divalent ion tolerance family protein n=1 Tax=Neisseria musculi TaxID=1815583 RepID=A0A7H1M9P0_9NEIS|nr:MULTISPECIES: divalent-cation tolerance protein CutA [Neisseria]MBF0803422.1 divalent-cation tolerance protein CutA [Neisseria sp. 19428wB4_WF04]QNT58355.1 cutA1 divalent ion tolerance family protein [Neisseria musculi]TFU43928.1 divalent-cation tolerance protein CutA [Neisseria sp. WF04]